MIKDYRILLGLALVGFVLFIGSLLQEVNPEYVQHQKSYYEQLDVEDYTAEIKQINLTVPQGMLIDRCQSCHIGAGNPDAAGLEQPLAYHPPIVPGVEKDPHDFQKMGCVVCHAGNGRALKKHDAHGEYHGWPNPLQPGTVAQASCNQCHAMETGHLPGAEVYEKGRDLFLEKACWGCHTIAGVSTASQAPELTDAGTKFSYEYIAESMIKPNANMELNNSKMPMFDWVHDEATVHALTTYIEGQKKNRLRSDVTTPIGYIKPAVNLARIEEPSIEAGRSIFAGVDFEGSQARGGCINCHAVRNDDGVLAGGNVGPELTYAIRSRGAVYVKDHISNSRSHVPDSIMPIFKEYNDAELDSLVQYLSTLNYKPTLSDGGKLYQQYCVSCHGENLDGRGVVAPMLDPYPRDFSKYQFVIAYKDRFKEALQDGVKGTAMPPWKEILSDEQMDTLIDYIEANSVKEGDRYTRLSRKLPQPGDPERMDFKDEGILLEAGNPERGYETFQKFCTSCHGKLANGKGPDAYLLEHPLPRNLLNAEFINQASVSDERLYQSILLGVSGTPMPEHSTLLSDQKILDLIAFIRANTTKEETK